MCVTVCVTGNVRGEEEAPSGTPGPGPGPIPGQRRPHRGGTVAILSRCNSTVFDEAVRLTSAASPPRIHIVGVSASPSPCHRVPSRQPVCSWALRAALPYCPRYTFHTFHTSTLTVVSRGHLCLPAFQGVDNFGLSKILDIWVLMQSESDRMQSKRSLGRRGLLLTCASLCAGSMLL